MADATPTCATCKHFKRKVVCGIRMWLGECTLVKQSCPAMTGEDDWCGEHSPKEAT